MLDNSHFSIIFVKMKSKSKTNCISNDLWSEPMHEQSGEYLDHMERSA